MTQETDYRTAAERLQWIQAATPEQIRTLEKMEAAAAARQAARQRDVVNQLRGLAASILIKATVSDQTAAHHPGWYSAEDRLKLIAADAQAIIALGMKAYPNQKVLNPATNLNWATEFPKEGNKMTYTIQVRDVSGNEIPVTIHETPNEVLENQCVHWDNVKSTPHPALLVGYLKRYLAHNACSREEWHIIAFNSLKDGSKLFSLYLRYRKL